MNDDDNRLDIDDFSDRPSPLAGIGNFLKQFTLIEAMIVVAMIGILASVILPVLQSMP
jgi:hypothetical protein